MGAVIATQFASATVITIAHRLHTIIGADKVVCLDRGQLVSFGSPAELLRLPESVFSQLVEETGDAAGLRARAAESEATKQRTHQP
jgi:ABC-type multidrug transport system fused ATPase/permease subunit